MKYSLKNQYKNILFENNSVFKQLEIDNSNTDTDVIVGGFSDDADKLWNFKDGSGGRGEYTVVYDILANSDKFDMHSTGDIKYQKMEEFLVALYSESSEYYCDLEHALSSSTFTYYAPDSSPTIQKKYSFLPEEQQEEPVAIKQSDSQDSNEEIEEINVKVCWMVYWNSLMH